MRIGGDRWDRWAVLVLPYLLTAVGTGVGGSEGAGEGAQVYVSGSASQQLVPRLLLAAMSQPVTPQFARELDNAATSVGCVSGCGRGREWTQRRQQAGASVGLGRHACVCL